MLASVDTSLCSMSATEALRRFRARTLSPLELLDALIERIDVAEPTLNAVCDRRYEEARAEAAAATERYARASGSPLPLDGVPVAAKEEHPMLGRSWTQGSLAHEGEIAPLTHPVIERIQAAGGVIHIRTTTPEFCCAGFTESRIWGVTRNPWNTAMSPGGSSGGSGAALAAGYAPLATGSDIGGRSGFLRRCAASSASSRRTAGCPRSHRSTSTSTATTARWRGPWRTWRCWRT